MNGTEPRLELRAVGVRFNEFGETDGNWAKLRRVVGLAPPRRQGFVQALADIDLDIVSGDRLGVIGLNGAGKSTLLKVLAGIYPPTSGTVEIVGHVCPLFEFATGFEMNLSGWDNIRIRGMLLGMHTDEIEYKLHDIAAFTELGSFLDRPVRTYSSGMFVRLAFAVSTAFDPEILLLDEVVGAGDLRFARKAQQRMHSFIAEGKIVVFTSHSLELVRQICTTAIWLEQGRIHMHGPVAEVVVAYRKSVSLAD